MEKNTLQDIQRDSIEGHVPLKNIGLDLVVLFYEEMTKRGKHSEKPAGPLIQEAKAEAAEWFPEMPEIVKYAADALTQSADRKDPKTEGDDFAQSISKLSISLQAASTLFVSNSLDSNAMILEDIGARYLECRGTLPDEGSQQWKRDDRELSGHQARSGTEDKWARNASMVDRLTRGFFRYQIDDESRGKAIQALMDFDHDNTKDRELWNTVLGYLDGMGLSEKDDSPVLQEERRDLIQTLRHVQPEVVRYFLYRCNQLAETEFVGVKDRFLRQKQYSYDEETKKFYDALQVLETAYIEETFRSDSGAESHRREVTESMDAHLLFFRLLGKTESATA